MRMTREQFAALLAHVADAVKKGDSLEGSIAYIIPEDGKDLEVTGSLRTGNLYGQGALILFEPSPKGPPFPVGTVVQIRDPATKLLSQKKYIVHDVARAPWLSLSIVGEAPSRDGSLLLTTVHEKDLA